MALVGQSLNPQPKPDAVVSMTMNCRAVSGQIQFCYPCDLATRWGGKLDAPPGTDDGVAPLSSRRNDRSRMPFVGGWIQIKHMNSRPSIKLAFMPLLARHSRPSAPPRCQPAGISGLGRAGHAIPRTRQDLSQFVPAQPLTTREGLRLSGSRVLRAPFRVPAG